MENGLHLVRAPSGKVLDELAALHGRALARSRISLLGEGFARSFYQFASQSPHECVVALCRDQQVIGGVLLSLSSQSLMKRAALRTNLSIALLTHPCVLFEAVFKRSGSAPILPANVPEVVAIFVDPSCQSKGSGALLLRETEDFLRERKLSHYMIRTENREDNRAIQFYSRHGFIIIFPGSGQEADFIFMQKALI